jgi:hypothetical protein
MPTFKCTKHGVNVQVSGERGENRVFDLPPLAGPGGGGGIPPDCALYTARTIQDGIMHRFDRGLSGPQEDRHGCPIEQVGS